LQSTYFKEFIEKNPQIELKVMVQRGIHPTLSSTYINGYLKEQPLRNLKSNEVLDEFFRARNSCKNLIQAIVNLIFQIVGRKHLPHSGKRVYGNVKSIQGNFLSINIDAIIP